MRRTAGARDVASDLGYNAGGEDRSHKIYNLIHPLAAGETGSQVTTNVPRSHSMEITRSLNRLVSELPS
nr:hypothetical protein [Sphingomonas sediminicola]